MNTGPFECGKNPSSAYRVTVIGSGVSGSSLAKLASELGYSVFVSEQKQIERSFIDMYQKYGISYESGGHSEEIYQCDIMILSSGISPVAEPVRKALEKGIRVEGEVDFTAPFLKGKILGITGSNGKTTTTLMTGHLFEKAGIRVGIAGNIGSPLADHANRENEVLVVELSSFQLFWSRVLTLDLAVVTNIEPDHIDWHGSLEGYYSAKRKIKGMVRQGGKVICQERDMKVLFSGEITDQVIPLVRGKDAVHKYSSAIILDEDHAAYNFSGKIIKLFDHSDIALLGSHNLENAAMSSTAFIELGGPINSIREDLASFKAPPHRCELVDIIEGVSYVDDSKGTNVAATVAALRSLHGRKIIILGGKGKGEDYSPLAEAVAAQADLAILIGEEKARIRESLVQTGFTNIKDVNSMEEAVVAASGSSGPGSIVLLSPACTSWDMYQNYIERGEDFKNCVNRIRKGEL